ncbi:M48 family metalloprotease, partial [Calidifontimicrobium sp. SYSU G02091]|uniref:M48 family metalloprotease n=1 Tax=Calidifontimicrobium sp. SYSU G02091 TaxID=2926421 RepID=UPI001F53270E
MRFRRHQEAAQASSRQLLALFVLVVAGLVLAVNGALALAYRVTVPWASGYPDWFFATNTALVLLYVLGGCAVESMRLREGGAHVARLAGAREADRADVLERRLANVVAEVAIAANTKPPAAWVLPREDAINAFAAGWSADDAVVAVTRGALERLDRAELQGVVAHEISHLVHGDTTLNMRLIGMVWGLRLLFDLGHELTEPDARGRRHAGVLFGLALMAVGALGWAAGRLLQAAVSRQREFLADASAVKYTRQVAGLGGALRKIAEQQRTHADALSARAGPLAHLFLVSSSFGAWWATHPPLAERIRRLYGRAMPDLPADPLPRPVADEPRLPIAALAPATGRAAAAAGATPAPPEAARHDAVQRPALADPGAQRATREAEALARIAHWQGPGELRAALLTLLRPAAAPPHAAAWQPLPAARAAAMQGDLAALGPAARLAVFDALARRAAQAP